MDSPRTVALEDWDALAASITVGFDFVLARKGADVMLMLYGDIGAPDATQLAGFAKQAVAKLPA